MRRFVFASLLFLATASLVASIFFIKSHLTYKKEVLESTRAQLSSLTFEATRSIDAITRNVTGNVNSVAEKLSAGELTHKAATARLPYPDGDKLGHLFGIQGNGKNSGKGKGL